MVKREETLLKMFPEEIRKRIVQIPDWFEQVQEIRLRAGGPLLIQYGNREFFVRSDRGGLCKDQKESYQVSPKQIRETLEHMASYSLYAFEEEIRQGYLTIPGGHRIGIAGKRGFDTNFERRGDACTCVKKKFYGFRRRCRNLQKSS